MARSPRSIRPLSLAAFALLVLAGCASPAEDSTGTPTTTGTGTSQPQADALHMTGCEAFHTFFPSPADAFAAFVPDNFTIDAQDGVVEVPVFGYACADRVAEMWALLPVVPPEALRNASYGVDAVILQALATNMTSHAQYLAWGIDPARVLHASGDAREYTRAGVSSVDRLGLGTGTVTYEVRTTVQETGGEFGAEVHRHWVTNGTAATGWVEVHATAARDLGAGTASFQSQGDPGAPPVAVGVAHRVSGVDLTVTHVHL